MSFIHRRALKRLGVVQTHPVSIRRGIKVRMPDGAELAADLYLGSPSAGAPVIMIRSPYGITALFAATLAYPLSARGYNVVMQSCRGTFGSAGRFDPHHDEQRDGLATLDWIKQQPWYGGSIATFGGSYLGYVQWAVAAAAGPEVKAMAMQATVSDFALMTYAGDSLMLEKRPVLDQHGDADEDAHRAAALDPGADHEVAAHSQGAVGCSAPRQHG